MNTTLRYFIFGFVMVIVAGLSFAAGWGVNDIKNVASWNVDRLDGSVNDMLMYAADPSGYGKNTSMMIVGTYAGLLCSRDIPLTERQFQLLRHLALQLAPYAATYKSLVPLTESMRQSSRSGVIHSLCTRTLLESMIRHAGGPVPLTRVRHFPQPGNPQ